MGEPIKTHKEFQPLTILTTIWIDVSNDFIVGVLKTSNKSIIMVVVDQLHKYGHFCALQHPFTSTLAAQILLDQNFKLHGMLTLC